MEELEIRAYGKINLSLDVLGKRENGYHDVRMVMQTVKLHDLVKLRKNSRAGEITIQTNRRYLPCDQRNLAWKAASLLMEEFHLPGGIRIDIKKGIPVSGGMAGGSSDAAAVLMGMNQLYSLELTEKQLMTYGVDLGADVPYCVMRGTALAEGIGEKLTPLPPCPSCCLLLVKPGYGISTKKVYEKLDRLNMTYHPDTEKMLRALERGNVAEVAGAMGNVLEKVVEKDNPEIAECKKDMMEGGALGAMMSGSGPTVFGIFSDIKMAERTGEQIRNKTGIKDIFISEVYHRES